VSNPAPNGVGLGEVRILRSATGSLASAWETIYIVDTTVTGQVVQHNAGLAKNGDSTLLIDEGGWGRLLLSTGNNFPDFNSWKLASVRFRVFEQASGWLGDDFDPVGPLTGNGNTLDGLETEIGARSWSSVGLQVYQGATSPLTTGVPGTATLPYSAPGTPVESIEAWVNPTGANWAGVGFLRPTGPGLASDGQVWIFQQGQVIRVRADGSNLLLYSGTPPVLYPGANLLRVEYRSSTTEVSAFVNGIPVVSNLPLSSLGFTPAVFGVTIQIHQGTSEVFSVDGVRVNSGGSIVFADSFETGTLDRWSTSESGSP
jgi:hypothetical protein